MDAIYEPSTDLGYIRLLLSDVGPDEWVFTDVELDAFLSRERSVKCAAAQALDTIADNEALTSKYIRTQDLATDGTKVADSLRKRAAALRAQAAREDEDGDETSELQIVMPTRQAAWAELTEYPRGWGSR